MARNSSFPWERWVTSAAHGWVERDDTTETCVPVVHRLACVGRESREACVSRTNQGCAVRDTRGRGNLAVNATRPSGTLSKTGRPEFSLRPLMEQ